MASNAQAAHADASDSQAAAFDVRNSEPLRCSVSPKVLMAASDVVMIALSMRSQG
jgi:hypothetical protein